MHICTNGHFWGACLFRRSPLNVHECVVVVHASATRSTCYLARAAGASVLLIFRAHAQIGHQKRRNGCSDKMQISQPFLERAFTLAVAAGLCIIALVPIGPCVPDDHVVICGFKYSGRSSMVAVCRASVSTSHQIIMFHQSRFHQSSMYTIDMNRQPFLVCGLVHGVAGPPHDKPVGSIARKLVGSAAR